MGNSVFSLSTSPLICQSLQREKEVPQTDIDAPIEEGPREKKIKIQYLCVSQSKIVLAVFKG